MIFDPKIFYQTYLQDYHKIKATYLKKMIDELTKFEIEVFGKEQSHEEQKTFKRVLLCDLRQTYFHSIETFFELFFALNPQGKKYFDDEYILYQLTNSDWRKNLKKIENIALNKEALGFLNDKMTFLGFDITVGQYIFYMGIFNRKLLPQNVFDNMEDSMEAIKYGIQVLANDFIKKEEYNAYKHGLRIIPAVNKIIFAPVDEIERKIHFDLSNSMSYYSKGKDKDELKINTLVFDPNRDHKMIMFCSNLIHLMIEYRKISMDKNKGDKKKEKFPIIFFGRNEIDECNKTNVEIQDLVYTMKIDKSGK